ncbi:hypothetical protein HMPREF1487_06431 [Pseudomonas sp. HPB0071]|uniref:Fe-S-cluster oxidoreductase n=1 Tax=Pseudomonas luteola TaxID=47886 RepID=A0A2X2F3B7_PSELU|nr:hypothetical protein HMPREF1487_06431 [Pseudomonas sp. HPB0071]SHJ08522.1 Putative zinc-or iron-chelating domain-containing protein [Pseudomonas zeshuii]SPZ13170.1 Fe-S-cluster oxidoreductase [Pseudomonas luteola]
MIPLHNLPASAPPTKPEPSVTCDTCAAKCCRLEVMLITDTGVPMRFIEEDQWGSMTMARLDDGWCAALDRKTMRCSIYENRPLICREFEMGGDDCLEERNAF